MTKQSHYNVGIYVRLSQEDERAGESISIENQKKMLTEYVSKQTGWNLVEIYEDDGYSGTDFNRPGVQKLLDDARSGKINLILCKDLSVSVVITSKSVSMLITFSLHSISASSP